MKQRTIENQQQRKKLKKFLLVLPLLILPFMTMAFWALRGGKGNQYQQTQQKGINTELPQAQFRDDQPGDKLSLYDQAAKDSTSSKANTAGSVFSGARLDTTAVTGQGKVPGLQNGRPADVNETRINQRLARLKQEISRSPDTYADRKGLTPELHTGQSATGTADADRLEKLIKSIAKQDAGDPEMKQLDGMLQKILDIQHPEQVTGTIKQAKAAPDSMYRAFRAVIAGNQKVIQDAAVKLRLLDTISIKGQVIPKGAFLYGLCQVVNQRLLLNIRNIRLGTSILPVDLTVYDLDGMQGINVPDAITQDAIRSGSDNAIQNMNFLPVDQTMTTQLAGAGIEAAKGLIGKKVKCVKVKLRAGYPLLLKNNQPGN